MIIKVKQLDKEEKLGFWVPSGHFLLLAARLCNVIRRPYGYDVFDNFHFQVFD
jgi:hypothetical protein